MSPANFEREILASARIAAKNKSLKKADIMEWAIGEITPLRGEIAIRLADVGCNICIPKRKDRR